MKNNAALDLAIQGAPNLGTVEVLSWFLDDEGLEVMAEEFCGRSRAELEKLAARKRPVTRNAVRDRVAPVFVGTAAACGQAAFEFQAAPIEPDENSIYFRSNPLRNKQELAERYQISFNAGEDFKGRKPVPVRASVSFMHNNDQCYRQFKF